MEGNRVKEKKARRETIPEGKGSVSRDEFSRENVERKEKKGRKEGEGDEERVIRWGKSTWESDFLIIKLN